MYHPPPEPCPNSRMISWTSSSQTRNNPTGRRFQFRLDISTVNLLKSNLITPRCGSRDVLDPLDTRIPPALNNLQIPHQQSRGSKHDDTEFHTDGRPTPRLAMRITRQRRLPRKRILCPARKPSDPTTSAPKARGGYFHSTAFSERSHFALPLEQRNFPSAVLSGVGTRTRTSVA